MKLITLIGRSLRFYRRTHLGVVGAAAVASAVLTGALLVGDSVTGTLHNVARSRLGKVSLAMPTGDRFFRAALAKELSGDLKATAAPLLQFSGLAARGDDATRRAGNVNVLAADDSFWKLAPGDPPSGDPPGIAPGQVALNAPLANHLGVKPGEQILLRVNKPSALPRDAPLSKVADASAALRLEVSTIVPEEAFGRFSLRADQAAPFNAFVPLAWLQGQLDLPGKANLLLVGKAGGAKDANAAVARHWQLADASLELRSLPQLKAIELRSSRIFIGPAVARAAKQAHSSGRGILTYFVNELRVGDRATPYSMVTAQHLHGGPETERLAGDEIWISRWLADDLGASVGNRLEMTYHVLGPMRRLVENTAQFKIAAILDTTDRRLDRELMPNFPGLADAGQCRDWDPGIDIDLKKIRDKDEAYWKEHRGRPKAMVDLHVGQRLWGNRFGCLTAIRWDSRDHTVKDLEARLMESLSPAGAGLSFRDVAARARAAADNALDFGQLFLGLSMFLIFAALLLTALVFALGVQQRASETGLLLAVGLAPRRVRRLMLVEGAVLAALGVAIGLPFGVLYTRMILGGLSAVWGGAVASATISFHARATTPAIGGAASFAAAIAAIWLVLRLQLRRRPHELLRGVEPPPVSAGRPRRRADLPLAVVCAAGAAAVMVTTKSQVAGFFAGGALLLVALAALSLWGIRRFGRGRFSSHPGVALAGLRAASRRPGRSLAVSTILACGVFIVVAVETYRHPRAPGAGDRSSGTGGFALYAASPLGVYGDLNTPRGRKRFALEDEPWKGVSVLPMRLREGDDASCLNLNRAQSPQLLGVEARSLAGRFTFIETLEPARRPWTLLDRRLGQDIVPAIGDEATVRWALGKSVGGLLNFIDEQGRTFSVKIVAKISNSILQGSLLISENQFTWRFPSRSGYRVFLLDAPPARAAALQRTLTDAMSDIGAEVTATADRLAAFSTIQTTYLSIFQALGSLGLVLGTAGLALVAARNIMERRGELAVLWAVGFSRGAIRRLVLSEYALLLVLGVACGALPAGVAILPAVRSSGANIPYFALALAVASILLCGLACIYVAAALATRGQMLGALRNE